MLRSRRSFAWSLVLALLCATLAVAQEPLVIRAAANTYVVDTAQDTNLAANPSACTTVAPDKDCTLRQAIEKANSDTGTSDIVFNIPPDPDPDYNYNSSTDTWTINPQSSLPALSAGGTTIVGRNDNAVGTPRIVLDGSALTGGGVGIRITSAGNAVKQLIIIMFGGTSGTTGIGIRINNATATGNIIAGNYIGNRPGDPAAYPNVRAGIQIDAGATGNFIGIGTNPGDRNVISGNGNLTSRGDGILVQNAPNNTIQGNYIGLGLNASFATIALPNTGNGIDVVESGGTIIGGAQSTLRNTISGNGMDGILLTGAGATGTAITGNYIGLNETGTSDLGNTGNGVQIADQAHANTVSGTAAASSVISGNGGYGVLITDDGTTANQITNNSIGVNAGGTVARPNDSGGVRIRDNAQSNNIGGASAGNVIAGNGGYGVSFGRTIGGYKDIMSNTVAGNLIGLNASGTTAAPNASGGVLIDNGTRNNRIGGSSAAERNVISGNGGPGVVISGTETFSNTVTGNIIGLRRATVSGPFTTAGANTGDGVLITAGAQFSRIGGTAAEANTIGANTGNGVHVTGTTTTNTIIQSNFIGVALNGATFTALGNTQNGVLVDGSAQRAKILDNHISRNSRKGIALDLQTAGPPGIATNANHDIDPPFNLRLNQLGRLTGRVFADGSNAACGGITCKVQIFAADPIAKDLQGRDPITPTQYLLTANGYFTATLAGALPAQLALTATDKDGNTSEFAVFTSTLGVDIGPPRSSSAFPGQTVVYTHRITNTGSVDFTDLRLSATSSRNWPFTLSPLGTTDIALVAQQSKLVTVTLTLPAGADPRVKFGSPADQTRVTIKSTKLVTVTDSVTNTTNILGKFILDASFKLGRTGSGAAGTVIDYTRTLTNSGNITGTVTLTASTDLNWTTIITPTSVQLPPGKSLGVVTSVKIPLGTIAGTVGKTKLTLNGSQVGQPLVDKQQLLITDTTTVLLTPKATMIPTLQAQGFAGKTVQFCHTVTNGSNGAATFSLTGVSSLGSKITFISDTPGRQLVNGTTFTVGITDNDKSFSFCANVLIDPSATKGQQDLVAIGLTDAQGAVVGGASVRDLIDVVGGLVLPRIYMPLIRR
jgi:hypothetical protein